MKDSFFQIIFESPPTEVELSTELKCREIMKSNDVEKIKAFCCDLVRNQTKIDAVLASALAQLAEQESKKMIEEKVEIKDQILSKGSEAHKASVVGDTVGDPFKDTSGPSLNILIKLMSVVSLVIAPLLNG